MTPTSALPTVHLYTAVLVQEFREALNDSGDLTWLTSNELFRISQSSHATPAERLLAHATYKHRLETGTDL